MLNGLFLAATLALFIGQVFADRACMLEGLSMREAFAHGWDVARPHLSTIAGLVALQLGAGILLNTVLHLPGLLTPLACLLRPLAWLLDGFLIAWFSIAWTLAYRCWLESYPPISIAAG